MRHALLALLAACGGGSSDWLTGELKLVERKAEDIAFTIEMPAAMTPRQNALGMRAYLTDEEQRTYGPWIDVEKAGYTPKTVEDMVGSEREGATIVAKEQRPDGSWFMAAIKKDAPAIVHVRWWKPAEGKKTLVCDANQKAEKTIADPEKVRARFEQICATLKYK
jgi:hypothetical protein